MGRNKARRRLEGYQQGRYKPKAGSFLVEALETRTMLTFVASMSAPQSFNVNQNYALQLSTTGGTASKWDIDWGDGSAVQTINAPSGGFAVPFQPTHPYGTRGDYAVTATATS